MKRDDGHYIGCIYGCDDGMGDWINDECYCEEIEADLNDPKVFEEVKD